MKNKKTIFLILGLVLIFVILVVANLFIKTEQPTSSPEPVSNNPSREAVAIINTSLTGEVVDVTQIIKLTLSRGPSTPLEVEITPDVPIITAISNNELIITPQDAWAFDTEYTLKVMRGVVLDKDYSYTFKTAPYFGI